MSIVMDSNAVAAVAMAEREAAPPRRTTTTLYDLMAALQAVVGPDDDALVVATVVHLLRSERLTFLGKTGTYPCQLRHEMRAC